MTRVSVASLRFWLVLFYMAFKPVVVVASPAVVAEPAGDVIRFALAVGANDGGPERERLRYANADAERFVKVMQELGGVTSTGTQWLEQPDATTLKNTLAALAEPMRDARARGERVQFIFYYSGHSDRSGLRLRSESLSYRDLRTRIASLPADVKIGILDSCESGAFTRLKGGARLAPFLFDQSNDVEGHAFLTSSAEHEAAQESDKIAGSFFTHALISGLRGAADVSGDGKVTLSEAYRFAFDETLARTQTTRGGAQHPAYDIRLAGTGDVVMTDLHTPSALLSLGERIVGRIYIRDSSGALVAELAKPHGRLIELGLVPGSYGIQVQQAEARHAQVTLVEGQRATLQPEHLSAVALTATAMRGREVSASPYEVRPLALTVFPELDTNPPYESARIKNHFGFVLGYGTVAAVDGLQLALGVPHVRERLRGIQVSAIATIAQGPVDGIQMSTMFNYTDDLTQGLQISSGANVARAKLRGIQASAGINLAEGVEGVQVAGGADLAFHVSGVQVAPVNLAETINGLQLGVVNIGGHVRGLQLGVVNYAQDADAQLGVLSFSRKHGLALQLSASDLAPMQAALRFNAGYTYGLVFAGVQPFSADPMQVMLGLGFGVSGKVACNLWIEGDLSWGYTYYGRGRFVVADASEQSQFSQARLLVRLGAGPVSFFAGPTLTTVINGAERSGERPGFRYTLLREVTADAEVLVRPGLAVGLQLL